MKRISLFVALFAMVFCVHAAKRVTWVIDAGHGGRDVGCEGTLTQEKDITLTVAKEVAKLVKKNIKGVRVVLTREKDKYLTLQERCDIANKKGAALFISIHVNAAANQFARGTESFFATNVPLKGTQSGKSELLALLLQRQYLSHGREISRGVKQRELYVCEHTNMPSVLTEIGFISNLNEEAYLNSKEGQQELAEAIYQALAEWKAKTKNGIVSQRDLRNLRFSHYAPISLATLTIPDTHNSSGNIVAATKKSDEMVPPVKTPAEGTAETQQTEATEQQGTGENGTTGSTEALPPPSGGTQQPTPSETKQTKEAETQNEPTAEPTSSKAGSEGTDNNTESNASSTRPYFAIQLMNTATKLKDGDYRLKGFRPTAQIPSGDRFKIIYGHSDSYKEIKNELAEVRETFPEAFIVAFLGGRQITTAEAVQLLKP